MVKAFVDDLSKRISESRIKTNEKMSQHTSFKIGGAAAVFVAPEDEIELIESVSAAKRHGLSYLLVGNGSNLLVSDKGTDLVICTTKLAKFEVDGVTLTASCGCSLSELASECVRNELAGFEFASGIPGTLGGAVFMNAGAYDHEMREILLEARLLVDGEVVIYTNAELELGYRTSILQKLPHVLLSARMKLSKGAKGDILSKMKELNKRRAEKQPLEFPSAGSTFKRPDGGYAGKLIMEAGLAGYSIGGAMVSEKHCGFVINTGNASADDVYSLIQYIKETVLSKCGIELEPELRFIGKF